MEHKSKFFCGISNTTLKLHIAIFTSGINAIQFKMDTSILLFLRVVIVVFKMLIFFKFLGQIFVDL